MQDLGQHGDLLDMRTVRQLVKDIGVERTREYFGYLDAEFALRSDTILKTFKELDLEQLARQTHALKSCVLMAGAVPLCRKLEAIESKAKAGDYDALAQIGELFELLKLTSEACRRLNLDDVR